MGLQKAETTPQGFTAASGYHRIAHFSGDPKRTMQVTVSSFMSRSAYLSGAAPYASRVYLAVDIPATDNLLGTLYETIKASTENASFLTDAIDILENE